MSKPERNRPAGESTLIHERGRARRHFITRTALAAAGATALSSTARAARSAAPQAQPSECADLKTPMREVVGKVAFITGGDSGIGLGIARAFTDAGMKVVITYRTPRHLKSALKILAQAADRVHAISVDVTDRPAMARAAEEAVRVFGKIHVLCNNAGVGVFAPLTTATYDDWDWGMGVNVNGVFNGVRTFLPYIRAHGEGGQIVSTASVAGLIVDDGPGIYSTSKFAVVGMMEALRAELAATNIGVSVFCPGIVNTDIGDSRRDRPAALEHSAVKPPSPKQLARMRAAMRHLGPPPGLSPREAGRMVLQGIRRNDLYILDTPELAPDLRARSEAILASLPMSLKVPAARTRLERMILGPSVYEETLTRRRCERARRHKT